MSNSQRNDSPPPPYTEVDSSHNSLLANDAFNREDPNDPFGPQWALEHGDRTEIRNMSGTRVPRPEELRQPVHPFGRVGRCTFYAVTRGVHVGITESWPVALDSTRKVSSPSQVVRSSWEAALEVYTTAFNYGKCRILPRRGATPHTTPSRPRNPAAGPGSPYPEDSNAPGTRGNPILFGLSPVARPSSSRFEDPNGPGTRANPIPFGLSPIASPNAHGAPANPIRLDRSPVTDSNAHGGRNNPIFFDISPAHAVLLDPTPGILNRRPFFLPASPTPLATTATSLLSRDLFTALTNISIAQLLDDGHAAGLKSTNAAGKSRYRSPSLEVPSRIQTTKTSGPGSSSVAISSPAKIPKLAPRYSYAPSDRVANPIIRQAAPIGYIDNDNSDSSDDDHSVIVISDSEEEVENIPIASDVAEAVAPSKFTSTDDDAVVDSTPSMSTLPTGDDPAAAPFTPPRKRPASTQATRESHDDSDDDGYEWDEYEWDDEVFHQLA